MAEKGAWVKLHINGAKPADAQVRFNRAGKNRAVQANSAQMPSIMSCFIQRYAGPHPSGLLFLPYLNNMTGWPNIGTAATSSKLDAQSRRTACIYSITNMQRTSSAIRFPFDIKSMTTNTSLKTFLMICWDRLKMYQKIDQKIPKQMCTFIIKYTYCHEQLAKACFSIDS